MNTAKAPVALGSHSSLRFAERDCPFESHPHRDHTSHLPNLAARA